VTRYLLDTNIISDVTKPTPSAALLARMAEQADSDLVISALTVGEIRRGLPEKPKGKKRAVLEAWFGGPDGPQALFAGRVLPFDEKAAVIRARLMADGAAKGRPRTLGSPQCLKKLLYVLVHRALVGDAHAVGGNRRVGECRAAFGLDGIGRGGTGAGNLVSNVRCYLQIQPD
jgi:toxin FitB